MLTINDSRKLVYSTQCYLLQSAGGVPISEIPPVFSSSGDCTMTSLARKVSLPYSLWAIAALLLAAAPPFPVRAAAPVPSLDLVPADAVFYSAMLRNREQFEKIVNSKAFAKIKALPYVQMGLAGLQAQATQPGSPAGAF